MTARPWHVRWVILALIGAASLLPAPARAEGKLAVEERLRRDVTYLASAECEGRGVQTKGINLAADYIARAFKDAGLKPAVPSGDYFQPFTMTGNAVEGNPNELAFTGPQGQRIVFARNEHFRPVGLSGKGQLSAPLVLVGYGVTADNVGYDDYRNMDVAGKVVVILRKTPRPDNAQTPFDGDQSAFHAGLETKLVKADLHKAAAVLFVNDYQTAASSDPLMTFEYTAASGSPAKIPVLHVRRSVIDNVLSSSLGKSLPEVEAEIDRTLRPQSAALAGWTADLKVNVERPQIPVKNVVGVIEGSGRLANETIVIGAHYDHLGYGGDRNSLASDKRPAIHHGADDNASGTTVLLELARRYGKREATGDRRRLVFIAFSAEEVGLLGSAHYCKKPLFPLESTAAMVNLDMVGRLRPSKTGKDQVYVEGSGTAKQFGDLLDQLAQKYNLDMVKSPSGNGPSDHASFYAQKIPVLFYWTGNHNDYHKPSDTADKINIAGLYKITQLSDDTITHLASTAERPDYVYIAPPKRPMGMRGGPRLGVVPNYADESEGVLLDGVAEGGPAAKAGVKQGDRIIAIDGKSVKNLNSYMVLMAGQKKGQTIEVTVLRKGEKVNLKIALE
jgi:hypothetical protein